jgi:hypothetical protein
MAAMAATATECGAQPPARADPAARARAGGLEVGKPGRARGPRGRAPRARQDDVSTRPAPAAPIEAPSTAIRPLTIT